MAYRRSHYRKGHWRRTKNGLVWVNSTRVSGHKFDPNSLGNPYGRSSIPNNVRQNCQDKNPVRFQDYFEANGRKYYTGTVLIVDDYKRGQEATFICYDTERKMYIWQIKEGMCHHYENSFREKLVEITDRVNSDVHLPQVMMRKDCHIDGLMSGWILYIFAMIVSTIFNDRIMMWVIWSVVFFAYRSQKIKEEGTYVKWR